MQEMAFTVTIRTHLCRQGFGIIAYRQSNDNSLSRRGTEQAKELIARAIADNLNVELLISAGTNSLSNTPATFTIADLGCSVGPNTFIAVRNIIDSVKQNLNNAGLDSSRIEFQVFFNDVVSNDFNTLFMSLPQKRDYFAVGMPGDFHGRLFPSKSLHFVFSSYALHWLSEVPKEVVEPTSPAYNKGRIDYAMAPEEVSRAFAKKFVEDIEMFLRAREEEVVRGGLLAFIIPCIPDGIPASICFLAAIGEILGSTLIDMVHQGIISEDKVDTFNLPRYHTSPSELNAIIERNGNFNIETMVEIDSQTRPDDIDKEIGLQTVVCHVRATLGGLIEHQFGHSLVDEVFERFGQKLKESFSNTGSRYEPGIKIFALLKRKTC